MKTFNPLSSNYLLNCSTFNNTKTLSDGITSLEAEYLDNWTIYGDVLSSNKQQKKFYLMDQISN